MRTLAPSTMEVPGRGSWAVTVPDGLSEGTPTLLAFRPARVSAATASVSCLPTTSGTSTVFLPVETLIVTIPPLARLVPSVGDCSKTIPTGCSELGRRCTFGSSPSPMIRLTASLSTMPVYCCTVTGLFSLICFWTLS